MSMYPQTKDEFKKFSEEFRGNADRYKDPMLFALGRRVFTKRQHTLASVRYPLVNGPGKNLGTAAVMMRVLGIEPTGVRNALVTQGHLAEMLKYFQAFEVDGQGAHPNIDILKLLAPYREEDLVATFIFDDVAPMGVEDSTLKLYGLSHRYFKPNTLNLKGIFGKLPNVTWIGDQPIDVDEVGDSLVYAAFAEKEFAPTMVDKFPLYAHRIPAAKLGIRIVDPTKVRLGAYLGEGTTVMPGASYINFNAGTEGPCMVEGRISSSAFVGAGSDIGGGASILGTLSGGNNTPITVGRNCLLEANSVLGVPVGHGVIVAAGTAFLASSRIHVNIEDHPRMGRQVKGIELAGINAATIRRDDCTGELCAERTNRNIAFVRKLEDGESILRADLHKN